MVEIARDLDGYMSWIGDKIGGKVQCIIRTTDADNDLSTLDVSHIVSGMVLKINKAYAKICSSGFVKVILYGLENIDIPAQTREVQDQFPMDYDVVMLEPSTFFYEKRISRFYLILVNLTI